MDQQYTMPSLTFTQREVKSSLHLVEVDGMPEVILQMKQMAEVQFRHRYELDYFRDLGIRPDIPGSLRLVTQRD